MLHAQVLMQVCAWCQYWTLNPGLIETTSLFTSPTLHVAGPQRNHLHLQGQRIGEQVERWWRFMVEKHHHGRTALRCWSGGAQQPDHTLVNLLENRRHIPGRGRGNERGKDGMYRKCRTHSDISGKFSDLYSGSRENPNSVRTSSALCGVNTCSGACSFWFNRKLVALTSNH